VVADGVAGGEVLQGRAVGVLVVGSDGRCPSQIAISPGRTQIADIWRTRKIKDR
jgi:hypothetical protein